MFRPGSHPLDRLYFGMMAGIGILSSTVILASLFFLTSAFDRHSAEDGNKRLSILLNQWTTAVTMATEDYANTQLSYRSVKQTGVTHSTTDPGSRAGIDSSLDWIAVLAADGRLISGRNLPTSWDATGFFHNSSFRTVLDDLAQRHVSEEVSVGGVFEGNGTPFIAAVTRIRPDTYSVPENHRLPFLIGGRNLDADAMTDMAGAIGQDAVFFSTANSDRSIPVDGPLGSVGILTWKGELVGARFRQIAFPGVLMICSGFVLLTSWMAAHFRKMVNNLERMHKVATTDHLTGVANRAALNEVLKSTLVQDALREGSLAAISLDLNDFKQLNDRYGHHAGDAALRIAAERITECVGKNETVFRMGGDEFLCLLFDADPEIAADHVVRRLRNTFRTPMDLGSLSRIVTPSIGVAIANMGEEWDEILERSDAAMYRSKRRELIVASA